MKKPIKDQDYVEYYAEKMKENNDLFKQQKVLIESQMKASRSLFINAFGTGEDYKKNARRYLKKLGTLTASKQRRNFI